MRKSEMLRRLRNLRRQYETHYFIEDHELPRADVYVLFDVCQALGLIEAETRYVLGTYYETYILGPVPYTLTPAVAFMVAFGDGLPRSPLAPAKTLEEQNG